MPTNRKNPLFTPRVIINLIALLAALWVVVVPGYGESRQWAFGIVALASSNFGGQRTSRSA